jgi:membrane protease YdiL (CAAX protease family)
VRRHPLRELWVRDASVFVLRWPAPVLAVALAGLPAYELGSSLRTGQFGSTEAWLLCCLAGAGLAAFAIREQRLEALRRALPAFLAALVLGCAVVAYAAVQSGGSPAVPFFRLRFLLTQFLFYFPVCFVLEEVVFRGALDAHVAQPGTTGAGAWMSAILVSVLWGLWHLPLAGANESFGSAAVTAVAVHTLIGVPLSFCWRKGGTLVLPCGGACFDRCLPQYCSLAEKMNRQDAEDAKKIKVRNRSGGPLRPSRCSCGVVSPSPRSIPGGFLAVLAYPSRGY